MEPYEFVYIKPKLNKTKVFFAILIVLIILTLSIYSGIKSAEYVKEKDMQKAEVMQNEQEKQILAKIEEEEEEKRQQEEANRLKNINPLTQEQIQIIENIYTVPEGEKRVFLTFDDGPTQSVTPFILDLLKQEGIKATFFVLGNRAKANPELIQREFNEGHYIANHGYSHIYKQIYSNTRECS